jgi:mannose-P-dolichol utilization defect protein 1
VSHTLLQTLASLLGMVMGAGSLLLYSPIVLRLVRTRSAEGMALSTWALQLFGFTAGVLYNATKGFPLTAYAETLSFTVQVRAAACGAPRCAAPERHACALSRARRESRRLSRAARRPDARPRPQSAAILVLVAHLQRRLRTPAFAAGGVVYVCLCVAGLRGMPPWALSTLQLAATVSVTGALVPQLLLNARRRSGGGWSPLTAGLSAAGNAVRVFTTVQLTRDPLLLGGFLAGFAVNAALLAQIFIYGDDPAKETAPA